MRRGARNEGGAFPDLSAGYRKPPPGLMLRRGPVLRGDYSRLPVWAGTLESMNQKTVDHVFIVTVVSFCGLFIGNTIGGLFGGIPLMAISGVLAYKHRNLIRGE